MCVRMCVGDAPSAGYGVLPRPCAASVRSERRASDSLRQLLSCYATFETNALPQQLSCFSCAWPRAWMASLRRRAACSKSQRLSVAASPLSQALAVARPRRAHAISYLRRVPFLSCVQRAFVRGCATFSPTHVTHDTRRPIKLRARSAAMRGRRGGRHDGASPAGCPLGSLAPGAGRSSHGLIA